MTSYAPIVCAAIEAKGCTAELLLNDIPLARIHPGRERFEALPVEEYLIPGSNWLEILVEGGKRPATARTDKRELDIADATVTAWLMRVEPGMLPDPARREILATVTFDRSLGYTDSRVFPQSRAVEVDLSRPRRWSWQDAPDLTLDAALIDEVDAALEELAEAYRSRSANLVHGLSEILEKDALSVYPNLTDAVLDLSLSEAFAKMAEAAVPVLPRDRASYSFRLVAGGRMVQCLDDDWSPSLKLGHPSGTPMRVSAMLARIGGRLRLVR